MLEIDIERSAGQSKMVMKLIEGEGF